MAHYWLPIDRITKHPALLAEKRQKKIDRRVANYTAKRGRDDGKRRVSRLARRAEEQTERNIIHATKNSGRRNKDGDHVSMGMITLDTKLQTTRENPVINLGELEKVRTDAMRAGKRIGGLVIRNKHGVGCVVLREEDYAILTGSLNEFATHRSRSNQGEGEGIPASVPLQPGTHPA